MAVCDKPKLSGSALNFGLRPTAHALLVRDSVQYMNTSPALVSWSVTKQQIGYLLSMNITSMRRWKPYPSQIDSHARLTPQTTLSFFITFLHTSSHSFTISVTLGYSLLRL